MSDSKRPNIIVFMTEQHRGDSIGANGHPVVMTPTIDHLAAQGVNFITAYSTCPICVAARRSFLTGRYPGTHGVFDNRNVEFDEPTVAGTLRDAGYQTAWIGRSPHQHPVRKHHGFEILRIGDHREFPDDYDAWLTEHQPPGAAGAVGGGVMHNDWTARPWHMDDNLHHTHWIVNEAIDFLTRRDPTRPFFLVVSFRAAHPPLHPPAFYFERYLRTGVPEPCIGDWAVPPETAGFGPDPGVGVPFELSGEALLSTRAAYYGLINHVDDEIRRMFHPLDGIDRATNGNTAVVFCSDHGEMLGDHYLWRKCHAYEGSAHIPCIIRPPLSEEYPRGLQCEMAVSLEDLMPTLLDFASVEPPDTVEGMSLLPMLRGAEADHERLVQIESTVAHIQSLTDGREKYIRHTQTGREQFFDLVQNPGELVDLGEGGAAEARVAVWRDRLEERLAARG